MKQQLKHSTGTTLLENLIQSNIYYMQLLQTRLIINNNNKINNSTQYITFYENR